MAILQEYHRPSSIGEAVALLTESEGRLAPLAGGTRLVGQLETRAVSGIEGVVDLRDLGLNVVSEEEDAIRVGAMCSLSAVMDHPLLGDLANGLLMRAARGEGPVNLRNAATVGGVIACAEYDSEFYTALLALGATVTVHAANGEQESKVLAEMTIRGGLIVGVSIPAHRNDGWYGGTARVARTPSDRPIVAAYATATAGTLDEPAVALCGVAPTPVLAGSSLNPPDDFKGSKQYRLEMAAIVAQRAAAETVKAHHDAT